MASEAANYREVWSSCSGGLQSFEGPCGMRLDPAHSTVGRDADSSELELERQLDRARSADLIERVKSAIRAAGPQTVGQGLRRAAEQRACQDCSRIGEVGVVQDVEELGPETKPHLL